MRKSIALTLLALLLPACGLKGPLYLPQQKPKAAPPAASAPASNARAVDQKTQAPIETK